MSFLSNITFLHILSDTVSLAVFMMFFLRISTEVYLNVSISVQRFEAQPVIIRGIILRRSLRCKRHSRRLLLLHQFLIRARRTARSQRVISPRS